MNISSKHSRIIGLLMNEPLTRTDLTLCATQCRDRIFAVLMQNDSAQAAARSSLEYVPEINIYLVVFIVVFESLHWFESLNLYSWV